MRGTQILLSIAVLVVSIPFTAKAQTERQLGQKYPKLNVYAVRPTLLLTVKYTSDGRVCEMLLEPRHSRGDTIVLVSTLSEEEVIGVVEEIVPESERGKRVGWLLGANKLSVFSGASFTTPYDYEKMTISFMGSTRENGGGSMVAVVRWGKRSCN